MVVVMSDRPPFNVRIDKDVQDRFRKFVKETTGQVHGEMGRTAERALCEYMDQDRYARIESSLQEIIDHLEEKEATPSDEPGHAHTAPSSPFERLDPSLRRNIQATLAALEKGEVTKERFERAVHQAGKTDPRTVNKYRRLLESHGILLPHPLRSQADEWVYGARKFAIMCENNEQVTPDDLDRLLGALEADGRFSEEIYRDALPDDFGASTALKIDAVRVAESNDPREQEGE